MSEARTKGVVVGLCMLAAGIAYFLMTAGLPRRGTVDAAFFPYALAIIMIGLGLLQTVISYFSKPAAATAGHSVAEAVANADSEEADIPEGAKSDYLSVVVSLGLIAGFAALMRPLGFPVAAALYLFFQFAVLSPSHRRIPHVFHAFLAITIAIFVFVLFRYGFDLLLPAGPLTPYLR